MADLPVSITPEDLARHYGFSPRKLRGIARKIGACRIVGNRMILLPDDVTAILEAIKPAPAPPAGVPRVTGDYAALVALRERQAKEAGRKK